MANQRIESLKSKIEKADEGHYFIHAFKKDGAFKTSHIKLSGAVQMFKKDPAFIYVRGLRHSGHHDELLEFLMENGFEESQVRSYLADAYTAQNYEAYMSEIDTEVANISVSKKEQIREHVPLKRINEIRAALESFKMSAAAPKPKEEPVYTTPKISQAVNRNDLKARLAALEDSKVLDVSHYDALKGTGAKTSNRTSKGTRRPLSSSGELNKVVFDFARDTQIAVNALVNMGYTTDRALQIVDAAQAVKPVDLSGIAVKRS